MYRTGHAASAGRPFLRCIPSTFSRPTSSLARTSRLKQQSIGNLELRRRPSSGLILYKPFSVSLQRYATQPGSPFDKIDSKHEEVVEHEKLEPHPEEVSTTSSVHEVFHEKGVEEGEKEEDMLAGVKADLVGFRLDDATGCFVDSLPCRKLSKRLLHSTRSRAKPSSLEWQVSCLTLQRHSQPSTWLSTSITHPIQDLASFSPLILQSFFCTSSSLCR